MLSVLLCDFMQRVSCLFSSHYILYFFYLWTIFSEVLKPRELEVLCLAHEQLASAQVANWQVSDEQPKFPHGYAN